MTWDTARLSLEPLVVEHAEEMVGVLADPALYTVTGGEPPTLAYLRGLYAAQVAGSGDPAEQWLNWVVRDRGTGAATGYVQATVSTAPGGARTAELAWVIGTPWQGRGYATEAAGRMARGLQRDGIHQLQARIRPGHARSEAVARRLGLRPTATLDADGERLWQGAPMRRDFPGISSRAYEHPADRTALTALRSLQGFDTALRKMAGLVAERSLRLMHLAMAVRVGPTQFPAVHELAVDAARVLDLAEVPEVYVVNDPRVNAMALGLDRPFVVLHTATLDLMRGDELRFVVGHEVGHIASGHAVYRTLLFHLVRMAARVAWVPLGALGVRAVVTALEEWARKSELSADRAGLLVCQDEDAALRALMKLAGGSRLAELDLDAFLAQAAEYDAVDDVRDSVLKLLSLQGQTHPFAVLRAAELRRWVDGGEYRRLLDGDYPLREDDTRTTIRAEVRDATRSYAGSVRDSADPLLTMMRDAAGAGSRWWQRFSGPGAPDGEGLEESGDDTGATTRRHDADLDQADFAAYGDLTRQDVPVTPTKKAAPAKKSAPAKKTTAATKAPAKKATTAKAPATKAPAKKVAAKAPAKKAPAKKVVAKAPAKKVAAKKVTAAKAPAKKAPAKKVVAKAPAKKAPAKKVVAKKVTAAKAPAKKAPAKKVAAKAPAKKAPAKKVVAKKVAAKAPAKTAAKRATTAKTPARRVTTAKAPAKTAAKTAAKKSTTRTMPRKG